MPNDKVVPFKEPKLLACIACKHHWRGSIAKCPICKSLEVIGDDLHFVPDAHDVFFCNCKNRYFKVVHRPQGDFYMKCISCGTNHTTKELGITT